MKVTDIIESITNLFGFELFEETDDKAIFTVISDKRAELDKKEIEKIIRKVKKMSSNEDVELFNSKTYEVLVRNETKFFIDNEIIQEDSVNKLKYTISKPSDEYLIFLMYNLNKIEHTNFLRRGILGHRLRRIFNSAEEGQIELFNRPILDLIKEINPRIETIQIESKFDCDLTKFEKLIYAFIFNLGYNKDYTIMPLRFLNEFIQPYRNGRLRRTNTGDIEAPKRTYSNELILHYQKGISSESIDHQFLSFYHVIEHFYEKVYNDDILTKVRSELTKPSFSYKRTSDLTSLIGVIQKRLKYKNDEFLINELEALELTLKKFVPDLIELRQNIENYNPELIQYFKSNIVPFSKGNKVNFESDNRDEIYKNLAKRIYFTRNCIVHSKESDKVKYVPFKDDKDLLNENYLLRILVETVIISDSAEL